MKGSTLFVGVMFLTALVAAAVISFHKDHFYTGVTLTLLSVLTFSGLCIVLEEKKEEDPEDDE